METYTKEAFDFVFPVHLNGNDKDALEAVEEWQAGDIVRQRHLKTLKGKLAKLNAQLVGK